MSDLGLIYGDYGQQAASAIKRRSNQSTANQQSIFYGQQRGNRNLEDLLRKFTQGFNPTLSQYGSRGLGKSGIKNQALSNYALDYQRNMDAARAGTQQELAGYASMDTTQGDALQQYLDQLKFNKEHNILQTASDISALGAFGG